MKTVDNKLVEGFNQFWKIYPPRYGRKVGKEQARHKFYMLKPKDVPVILQATMNYSVSRGVKAGIGIKDPHRFIKDGKQIEIWREYIFKPSPTAKQIIKREPRKETPQERAILDKIKALSLKRRNWTDRAEMRKLKLEIDKLQKQFDDLQKSPQKVGVVLENLEMQKK